MPRGRGRKWWGDGCGVSFSSLSRSGGGGVGLVASMASPRRVSWVLYYSVAGAARRRCGGSPSQNLHTRWASGSGRPGDATTFAAARVLGRDLPPMSRANAAGVSVVGDARPRSHKVRRAKIARKRSRSIRAALRRRLESRSWNSFPKARWISAASCNACSSSNHGAHPRARAGLGRLF